MTGPETVARSTTFALLVQATTTAFTAVMTLYLIRVLEPDGFGVFALALGIAGVAGLIARFGIPPSLSRFIAENRTDPQLCASLSRDALGLISVTAALGAGTLFLAAGPIAAAYDEPDLTWPLRGMAISLFAECILLLYLGMFIALSRIAVNLRVVFVESAVETSATIALVAAGMGAAGAAWGRATGYAVGAVAATTIAFRLLGRVSRTVDGHRAYPRRRRALLRYALPLFVIDAIYGLLGRVGLLLVGAYLSAAAVGVFAAPQRLLPALEGVALAVANSISPRQAASRDGRSVGAFTMSLRWLMLFYAALVTPLVVWADPIVDLLFGDEYAGSANVLRLLAPFIFLDGISPLISTTVNYLGDAGRRIPIAISALAVNVAINVVFLPRIGVDAAAIGASAAFCVYVPLHLRICRQHLGFPLRPIAWTFVRALTAASVMGGTLALVGGTSHLSLGGLILGVTAGLGAYVLTLFAVREVSLDEVRLARGAITRWRESRRGRA